MSAHRGGEDLVEVAADGVVVVELDPGLKAILALRAVCLK